MSLISRLLNGATGASTPNTKPLLDSKVDSQYSYNLLFPDPESLGGNDTQLFPLTSESAIPAAAFEVFDVNGEIDLEVKDVRVILMQEAAFSVAPYLLYDSHPAPPATPPVDRSFPINVPQHPTREARRSISAPRKPSVGQTAKPVIIQDGSPGAFGAFGRRPTHNRNPSQAETDGQRSQREYKEEIQIFSQCIFGNSEFSAYKGTTTKFHPLPSEHKNVFTPGSYAGDGSLGRSSLRGGSKLSQSFTSGDMSGPTSAGFTTSSTSSKGNERKRVLITRMFPVQLPTEHYEEAVQDRTPTAQSLNANEVAGYPFPNIDQDVPTEMRRSQPKQKKTPMYAVGIIVTLPPSPVPQVHTSRSSIRAPGSYTEQDSVASSFNSTKRAGWTMLPNEFGVESVTSAFSSDMEDKVDIVAQNWDIIMRTLAHLQSVSTAALLPLLRQADISSPDPRRESFTHSRKPSASVSIAGKRVADEAKPSKPPKTNAKSVSLMANSLVGNEKIQLEVLAARERIVGGLRASRVITSQGRWGIWREEARLANKWAGGREEGFFFFNLLTGFLGNHTEWMQSLSPYNYRRRHYQQQRANKDDDISLPARTIIISDNKIMARRLIFLLAAFLPASQPLTHARIHRPSTSTSYGGYSQSPPGASYPREESLRRRLNKPSSISGIRNAHARTMSFPTAPNGRTSLDFPHHERRPSDAHSIRTANLPIPGSDVGSRKSSAVTTSTGTSVTTMPHFSTRRPLRGTGPLLRPGSSGSVVSDDLKRTLKRDSSSQYSNVSNDSMTNSRWSSIVGGFWGSRRRDSSASTSVEPLAFEGLEIKDERHRDVSPKRRDKLQDMVDEPPLTPEQTLKIQEERAARKSDGSAVTARQIEDDVEVPSRTTETPPFDPDSAYQSPVKSTINVRDGVIDIDVPVPDFLTFETAVSSPSSSGYMSTPGFGNGLEGFEHFTRAGPESETTLNVGGWLPQYQPDFALHAIPTAAASNIIEQVKDSMRSEPTPIPPLGTPHGTLERWIDVSSAVVADASTFTIKHILYRRRIKLKEASRSMQAPASLPNSFESRYGNVHGSALLTPSTDIQEGIIDEEFIEEPIISLEESLVDVIEKIIAQSGQVTAEGSITSSRASSPHRRDRTVTTSGDPSRPTSVRASSKTRSSNATNKPTVVSTHLEVPRNECKRMILGALENIVLEVVEGRKEGAAHGGGSAVDGARDRGLERGESFLREGVRLWLEGVEAGN